MYVCTASKHSSCNFVSDDFQDVCAHLHTHSWGGLSRCVDCFREFASDEDFEVRTRHMYINDILLF